MIAVRYYRLYRDLLVILVSILATMLLMQAGIVEDLLTRTQEYALIGSFVAGIFFTSIFTLAPAAVVLGELSQIASPWLIALSGGLGAMFGDLLIFFFIRDVFAKDLREFLDSKKFVCTFCHFGFLRWLYPVFGAILIASPLPDELGLVLLGTAKVRLVFLIPIAFIMNTLGILLIALVAGSV